MKTINPLTDEDRYIKVKLSDKPERIVVLSYSAGMLEISVWNEGMEKVMAELKVPMKPEQ